MRIWSQRSRAHDRRVDSHGMRQGGRDDTMSSPTSAAKTPIKPRVHGVNMDEQTRCAHYHTELDIIAFKLRCCGEYYACKDCHDALAHHALAQWRQDEYNTAAILCGACQTELTISTYLQSGSRCPSCGAGFNPRCSLHHGFYFAG